MGISSCAVPLTPALFKGQLDFPSKLLFAKWVSILESLKCSIWHIIKCELFSPLHRAENLLFTWERVQHFDLCYLVGGWSEDSSGLLQAPGPFLLAQTWSIAERFSVCLRPAPLPFFLLPSPQLSRPPGPASSTASQSIPLPVTSNLTSATTMTIQWEFGPLKDNNIFLLQI